MIAVLAGGPSCEREISLISGRAVLDALQRCGWDAILIDPTKDVAVELKAKGVSAVFVALHGNFGEDGTIQRYLDEAGMIYTVLWTPPAEASLASLWLGGHQPRRNLASGEQDPPARNGLRY